MKQAILVWSFRQNIIPGSFLQKSSFSTHGGAAVGTGVYNVLLSQLCPLPCSVLTQIFLTFEYATFVLTKRDSSLFNSQFTRKV